MQIELNEMDQQVILASVECFIDRMTKHTKNQNPTDPMYQTNVEMLQHAQALLNTFSTTFKI